ncbi:IclR family transcriptional regulator [Bordetella sp. 2513F-2]
MAEDRAVAGGAERVLSVLATLARQERPLGVAALVELTGLAQSTLYRQLALLKRWGFVSEHAGEYGPGPLCLQLAWGFDQSSFLIQESQEDMAALAAESGETVGLMAAIKDQAVCLDMVESQHPLRCSFVKGRGLPLVHGASARSLLAFMPEPRRQAALESLRARLEPAAMAELEQSLAAIRAAGHAVTDSQVDQGVWGASAPIFQRPGHAIASLTLMAPSTRAQDRAAQLAALTVQAARRISARLQSL